MGRVEGATLIKEIIDQRTDIAGHEQVVLKVIILFYNCENTQEFL